MYKKRLIRDLAAFAVLGIMGVVVLLALLRSEHNTEISLPPLAGPLNVSRTVYHWVDDARTDSLSPIPGKKRELMVWIWYPSVDAKSASAVYMPAAWRAAIQQNRGALESGFFMRDLSLVQGHSSSAMKVSPALPFYPVVILRSDIGALVLDYTALAEDLASHGYIVVGIDAPYSTSVVVFPDGRTVTETTAGNPPENVSAGERDRRLNRLVTIWSADTRFVLDRLEQLNAGNPSSRFSGRLDPKSVGIFGHSFGGAVAAQFCYDNARCKAGIDMDGDLYSSLIPDGLNRQFLLILSDHDAVYNHLPRGSLRITVRGARSLNFTDEALLKDLRLSRMLGELGPIDPSRGLEVTSAYISAFFNAHLKNSPSPLLAGPSPLYPEVQFDSP
jgi:dienelactone hydrolase